MPDEIAVVEAPVESITPVAQEPTIKDRVNRLSGAARDHWRLEGDLEGAEALMSPQTKSDAGSASSPDTPSENAQALETEAASEPAVEEQPKVGETPEQKSERKRRNDDRRWRDLTREAASEKTRADLLEKQLAEYRAASAPAKIPEKPPEFGADRPELPDIEKYDDVRTWQADLNKWRMADAQWLENRLNQRFESERSSQASTQRQQTWAQQVETEKAAAKDFEAVAFSPQTPASDVMILKMQEHKVGAKIAYFLGKNRDVAQRIAKLTDIPNFASLDRRNPQHAYTLGKAEALVEAEFDRIADQLSKKTAPPKDNIAQLPKPTGEVAVEPRGSVVKDELDDAIERKDLAAYKRIMRKREMAELGAS